METQGVYVDVLLTCNFMVDYLLLASAQLLCRRKLLRKRLVAGALLGAASSLLIFLPGLKTGVLWSLKLLFSAFMEWIARPWSGWKSFFAGWLTLFAVTFLYGGAMLALRMTAGRGWMLCANGVVYFHVAPLTLVLCIACGFALVSLMQRLFPEKNLHPQRCMAEVHVLGKQICCMGLVDSGNLLREPFSGWPVILMDKKLLSAEIPKEKLRMVPYHSVGGEGLLPAVRGERLTIYGEEALTVEQFYVALQEETFGDDSCSLLLSGGLLNTR
ncbi:MAG: sigma-E processing peptidase SpoIIGA [Oscillospiraceae bacterium]|nr:sigma-E processing peptidase SpoIIGA [Oscillospiraceae bacterium]